MDVPRTSRPVGAFHSDVPLTFGCIDVNYLEYLIPLISSTWMYLEHLDRRAPSTWMYLENLALSVT